MKLIKRKQNIIVISILIVLLSFSLSKIISWIIDNRKTLDQEVTIQEILNQSITFDQLEDEIAEKQESDYYNVIYDAIDLNKFKKLNSDTIGFIQMSGTRIKYPIVQSKDNEYYLKRTFNKSKSKAGWIYMDYRNDIDIKSKNTIIYGHARVDNSLFGTLKKVVKDDWLKKDKHQITINSFNEKQVWQVFSVYTIKEESYYLKVDFNYGDIEYKYFLNEMKNRSIYDFKEELDIKDYILTLSTCLDNFGNRIVVHAKLTSTTNL